MSNILIVGCGLIGSSILRAVNNKKIFKNIFVLEKSKTRINKFRISFVMRALDRPRALEGWRATTFTFT